MKTPLSSFIVHLSSFALLLAFGNAASAQWIIDGQQTQVLKLDVSDSQALYTDGSREMTAPLVFSCALTATAGMIRATIPWAEDNEFFIIDGDEEVLKLTDKGNVGFQIGPMIITQTGIFQTGEGDAVDFGEHMLSGGWQIDQVLPYPEAVISRGYADARYVLNGQDTVELGLDTVASGDYAAAFGYKNHASGKYSVAFNGAVDPDDPEEGIYTNVASGIGSAVFGWGNVASGNGAVAFGRESEAGGDWSLAAGSSDAIGEFSTALGEVCTASGSDSFAAGYNTSAPGSKSAAFGHSTTASAQGSFANGFASIASGNYSTAWGSYCEASGLNAIALGNRAKALHPGAVVIADSQNADATSATNDTFTVRAQNGVYLQTDAIHSSGPLVFDSNLTATNGALQIYATDSDDHLGYFKSLSFQDGLQFSTAHSASLFFGMNSSDGLLIGPDSIMQLGYNTRIEFETGTLSGGTGKRWHVAADPTEASGIVNKGYADSHYLRAGENLTAPLSFSSSSTATSGLFRAYNEWNGTYENLLIYDADNELIKLGELTTGLQIGGLNVTQYQLNQPDTGRSISFEEGLLHGSWGVFGDPDTDYGIVGRGYADGRYLQRTEGITTNHTFQAGDVLVISNGLITAINP